MFPLKSEKILNEEYEKQQNDYFNVGEKRDIANFQKIRLGEKGISFRDGHKIGDIAASLNAKHQEDIMTARQRKRIYDFSSEKNFFNGVENENYLLRKNSSLKKKIIKENLGYAGEKYF